MMPLEPWPVLADRSSWPPVNAAVGAPTSTIVPLAVPTESVTLPVKL